MPPTTPPPPQPRWSGVGRFAIPVVAAGGVPLAPDPCVPGGRVLVLPLENAGDAAGYAACSCAAP